MSDPTPPRVRAIGAGVRCLVVDDHEAMRRLTVRQLRQLGIEQIQTAKNGAEALRLMQSHRFDVVLSDWNMPVMSGIELLEAIRADKQLFATPFILVTAEAERSSVEQAIACVVTSLLLKPYVPNQLIARLERALAAKPRAPGPSHPAAGGPAAHSAASRADAAARAEEDPRPSILIVDDTADNLVLLSQLFKGEFRVRMAQSGAKALEFATSDEPPDLVLLDIMMPGMDGFEVARAMREHPVAQVIPIIFITAMTSADARLQGLDLGAVDFITKPIDPATLKPRVRNFMRYVQLRKNLQAEFDAMVETAQLREDVERMTRHDVKAPLAGALGLVQTVLEDEYLARRQTEHLRLAEECIMQALNLINLSSELYRIENGSFTLRAEPVRIGDLLRRIAEMDRIAFAPKALSISVDTDMPVGDVTPVALGDATLCYSVFQNLLKNACEAAPQGSTVSIRLWDQTPLRIDIQNHGVVPVAVRDRFFEKYVTSGKRDGSGIGTYSARLLVQAQHGDIGLEVSDAENWTRVSVTLPRGSDSASCVRGSV
jgi:two-component system sensor histidine kinase/response regulator